MGAPPDDTFLAFVDVLADVLDDHEATGSDLAARLHLSRSHFDRIISAVAGEPPSTMRRRILLERSAHHLLTTPARIIDIAVDAGFTSQAAFTRAFTRSYGRAPGAWRRHPSRIQIDAPNGVHFHPPGGLRLPASTKVTQMDLLTRMVEHHVWLLGEMITRAATMTHDDLDRPIEISVDDDPQTLRGLLSRLVGQLAMWNSTLAGRDYDWSVEEMESVSSLRTRLAHEGPVFLAHVRDWGEHGRLDESFVDALCEPAEVFTFGGVVAHVLTVAAHRRALALQALSSAGVGDLERGDPMRWVAAPAG